MDKKIIPRGNSAAFTLELYDVALSIVTRYPDRTIDDAIDEYCIGWCDSGRTAIPDNGKAIALMFEDEDGNKTWFHYYRHMIERYYVLAE